MKRGTVDSRANMKLFNLDEDMKEGRGGRVNGEKRGGLLDLLKLAWKTACTDCKAAKL